MTPVYVAETAHVKILAQCVVCPSLWSQIGVGSLRYTFCKEPGDPLLHLFSVPGRQWTTKLFNRTRLAPKNPATDEANQKCAQSPSLFREAAFLRSRPGAHIVVGVPALVRLAKRKLTILFHL